MDYMLLLAGWAVAGAAVTLLFYALGRWREWWGGGEAAVFSIVIGAVLIWAYWYMPFGPVHDLGDLARRGVLGGIKIIATIGWVLAAVGLGWWLA